MKNKISILLVFCSYFGVAQSKEEFTRLEIKGEGRELLDERIKCVETGGSLLGGSEKDEQFRPLSQYDFTGLLKNKNNVTVQTSFPIGSKHRFCSTSNVEAIRKFITSLYDKEQVLFSNLGFELRSGTLCAFSDNRDSEIIFIENNRNNQVESKKSAVIKAGEVFSIAVPCKVVSVVIHDQNVSNAELGYRASSMLRSGEGAEYHCEKFSMKLTRLTEENGPDAITSIKDFFPTNKSK